ncbi:hypothetical protein [Luteimonas vadosa]|uniref:Uncharacterized protein n=1 Tax=Luteimonas vadosa TaxID=1165507 RepID=A0ABP9DTC2_9GAMM
MEKIADSTSALPGRQWRTWAMLVAIVSWLWARSSLTPWAPDPAPRLWLYDTLFYLGFALLAWWLAEVARVLLRPRAGARRDAVPLVVAALAFAASLATETAPGWAIRTELSQPSLHALAEGGYDDTRRRAGWFLVDTVREPCRGQAWLWLGRPHGGGKGTGQALVRTGTRRPMSPAEDAFAFVPAGDGWWVAYQDSGRYHARRPRQTAEAGAGCVPGRILPGHSAGRAFLARGRERHAGL